MTDRSLYLSLDAANKNFQAQQVAANNLANAKTTGFKADRFASYASQALYEIDSTHVYSMNDGTFSSLSNGAPISTQRPLDVSINGSGFFAILNKHGEMALTRAGHFVLSDEGQLLLPSGEQVLGDSGPLMLPAGQIEFSTNGELFVIDPSTGDNLFQAKLLLANPPEVIKKSDGFFYPFNGSVNADDSVLIEPKTLEDSNVNPVAEMTSMIEQMRHFEMNMKCLDTISQNDSQAVNILRLSS